MEYLNAQDTAKLVKSVVSRAGKWTIDVQRAALNCINHLKEHGDSTLAVSLVQGLSKSDGVNKSALKNYMEAFCIGEFVEHEGVMGFNFDHGKGREDIDLAMAEVVQWSAFKKPSTNTAKNLDELIEVFLKQIDKSVKAGKVTDIEREVVTKTLADMINTDEMVDQVLKAVA